MQIGIIGLGKMGLNLAINMASHGHDVIGMDVSPVSRAEAEAKNITVVASLTELSDALPVQKIIWIMVPSGHALNVVLTDLTSLLSANDIIIDGGNSNYKDSIAHAEQLLESGIHFFDIGTSGGTSGANEGACLMVGGNQKVFSTIEPLINDISTTDGYLYTGPVGSGHFLKMVHNGIEYGMMQAIAEGFEVLEAGPFAYDLAAVAKVWNNGSVIRSWLMELAEDAFVADPKLAELKGIMQSSGEGKWTVETALDYQIPTPVIALSLMMRYRSLQDDTFSGKVVAALRNGFGGHSVEKSN